MLAETPFRFLKMAAKEKDIQVRALLVEDKDIIIESLTELMKSMGFIAVNSKTGSEAINLLNGGSVGIGIADDKCGDKEGLEVLEEAKRISPSTTRLLLTGRINDDAVQARIARATCLPLYIQTVVERGFDPHTTHRGGFPPRIR